MKLGEHGVEETQEKPTEPKDSTTIAAEILADPELPAEDFARARTDPEFMKDLVEKRRSAPPAEKKVEDAKPTGEGGGDKEGEGEGADKKDPKEAKGEGDDKGADEKNKPKGPRRGGYRRQVERLHEEVDSTNRENAQLRAQLAAKGKPPTPAPTAETPRPNEDDFDDHIAFIEALSGWKAEQQVAAVLKKRDDAQAARNSSDNQKKAGQDLDTALTTQAATSQKKYEDWDEQVDKADEALAEEDLAWSTAQAQAFAMTGQFGEIAYYLGQHTDEAVRLAQIANPANFMRALGRIEAKLEAAPEAQPKEEGKEKNGDPDPQTPKTPLKTPVGAVVKGSGSGGTKDAEWWAKQASPEEYAAARKKRDRVGTGSF